MQQVWSALQHEASILFAATVLLVVFFLIARVARARQSVALAFATMPLLLAWAVQAATAAAPL